MSGIWTMDGGHEAPEAPFEIRWAVQDWAANWGRSAELEWNPHMGCFCIFLSLKPDDPNMRAWRMGDLKQDKAPTEAVPLHYWDSEEERYKPLALEEYGANGILEMLNKGNTWSGRGEYPSLMDACRAQIDQTERKRRENRAKARESGKEYGWLHRRSVLGIPYITAGLDLSNSDDESLVVVGKPPTEESEE